MLYTKFLSYIFALALLFSCASLTGLPDPSPDNQDAATVSQVIDGDDILLSNENRIRLIGIDAPESINGKIEPYELISKNALEKIILGKSLIVEYGKSKDKKGRFLAYVYVKPDQSLQKHHNVIFNGYLFVNAYLVKMGHALPRRYQGVNSDYERIFFDLLIEAHQYRRGLWDEKWDLVRYKSTN